MAVPRRVLDPGPAVVFAWREVEDFGLICLGQLLPTGGVFAVLPSFILIVCPGLEPCCGRLSDSC